MPKVVVVIAEPSFSARKENRRLTGYEQNFLYEKAARAGLMSGDLVIRTLADFQDGDAPVVVTLGETAMQALTGKQSLWKWHLSPLDAALAITQKAVPTFDFTQIWKDWQLGLYFEMALKRAAQNATPGPWVRKEERYDIGFDPESAIAKFEAILKGPQPEWLSIDIETGRQQVNTFGVATSANDAIAVKVLPDGMPAALFHKLWSVIRDLCESEIPKVMQNGIYERTYLSRYGIHIREFRHDTMCAMKFLWPEFEKGLDNVGRIYTMERYWKDDARVASEAGKQKDWGNIRDWNAHFTYNCRDTSNTLIACLAQREDLARRGLLELHDSYLVQLYDCVAEMGAHGFPLSTVKQSALIAEYEARSASLVRQMSCEINPRSSVAKKKLLRDKGYVLPINKQTKSESVDELSLKKLRLKYPEDGDIKALLQILGVEKALSSYFRVKTLDDKRIRFMMDPVSTETWRMSASKDPWGGLNVQTLPEYAKSMIEWSPDEDRLFMDIDLSAAETWFVAYDAVEETMLRMLHNREDIHKFVASEIYKKPMIDVTQDERGLGKKSGHAGNYGEGPRTFMENCLKEMDLVLSLREGTNALESYHRVFPGVRRWQAGIREKVYRDRRLINPFGMVRYFYGRMDDATYREAYAHNPQSTVPQIINHLMLKLCDLRKEGTCDFWLHAQTHDSLTLSCRRAEVDRIARFAHDLNRWHPELILAAGQLRIPVECKFGRNLGEMQKWTT